MDDFEEKAFKAYEVELTRCFPDPDDTEEDPNAADWAAEWGIVGNSAGTEDTDVDDIAAVVDEIVAEVREYATRKGRPVPIAWTVTDAEWSSSPTGDTAADALAAAGVVLPERVDPA